MKNPIEKKILHTLNEDCNKIKSVMTITLLGVVVFKRTKV